MKYGVTFAKQVCFRCSVGVQWQLCLHSTFWSPEQMDISSLFWRCNL